MSGLTRIHKNSIFLTISTFSRLITNALIFIVIARYYGPETFGSFATAYTLSMVFLLLGDFGFDLLITTEIARNRDKSVEIIKRFFPVKVLFTSLALILLISTSLILPSSVSTRVLVLILSLNMVFTTLTNFFYAVFKGIERFQYEAKITFFINVLLLIGAFLFAKFRFQIFVIAVIMVVVRLIGMIMAFKKANKVLDLSHIKFSFTNVKNEIKQVSYFGLEMLFAAIYFQIDTVLLNSIKGEAISGLYQAAIRLLVIILIIPDIIVSAIFPTITRLYSNGDIKWKKLGKLFFKILFLTGLPIVLIIFEFSNQIIKIVYNRNDFLAASFILKIAAFIILARFCFYPFSTMLTITGNQRKRTLVAFLAAVINITLNLIFIPRYGTSGAIVISLITNVFAGSIYILYTLKLFKDWAVDRKFGISVFAIILLRYLLSFWNNISIWVFAPLIIIIFFTISILINFNTEERSLLFSFKLKGMKYE